MNLTDFHTQKEYEDDTGSDKDDDEDIKNENRFQD